MQIAPAGIPHGSVPSAPTHVAPLSLPAAAPAPVEPRDVLRGVLTSVMDAMKGAYVATTGTAKFDTSLPYWVNRASRLIGTAQGAMTAAVAMLPLVPGISLTPMVVLSPLEAAQTAIGAAVEQPVGSMQRSESVAAANYKLKVALQQLGFVLQTNWPS